MYASSLILPVTLVVWPISHPFSSSHCQHVLTLATTIQCETVSKSFAKIKINDINYRTSHLIIETVALVKYDLSKIMFLLYLSLVGIFNIVSVINEFNTLLTQIQNNKKKKKRLNLSTDRSLFALQ